MVQKLVSKFYEVLRKLAWNVIYVSKVGPLENNSENIISDGFQMAEVLNEYFSSVFTTEDISSLPVPFTKFKGNKSEHLGQLFVTPEMIAKKIKEMKDNKSPGVDGIPPKLLKEIVDQISTPLANLFNLSLEEGIVPSEWKGETLRYYLRRDRGRSQKITDQ